MNTITLGNEASRHAQNNAKVGGQITLWALILMSINVSGSFGGLIQNYIEMGWIISPAFLIACSIYLFPFAFIILEFISLKKTQGDRTGLNAWVRIGAGRKLAFLTAFMFWFANLTFFMGALPNDINQLSFTFTGRDVTKEEWYKWMLPFAMVAMFFLVTWISTKGTRGMTLLISIGGTAFVGFVGLYFLVSTGAMIGMGAGAFEGYGGIAEKGFYISNSGVITGIDSGTWMPNETVLYFSDQASAEAMAQNIIKEMGGTNLENGVFTFTTTATNGAVTNITGHVALIDGDWTLKLDHTYTTAENPFVINKDLLSAPSQRQDIIWGTIGGINWTWFSTFVWVIMACDGLQGYATYADEIKGGRKAFKKGLLIGVLGTATLYIFGMFFISVFPGDSLSNASQSSEALMIYFLLGNLFGSGVDKEVVSHMTYSVLGLFKTIAALGSLILWTSAPVRVLFNDTENGMFGSWLTKRNASGVPYRGAWLQFWILVPLLTIPYILTAAGTGDSVNEFIELVKTAGGSLGMIPPIFIFFAYFNLRLKHDQEDRTYRMGSRKFGLIVSGILLGVYGWIFLMSFFPYEPLTGAWDIDIWGMHPDIKQYGLPLGTWLNIAALVLVFFPLVAYYMLYERKQRDIKIAIDVQADEQLILLSNFKDDKNYLRQALGVSVKHKEEITKFNDKFTKKYLKVKEDEKLEMKERLDQLKAIDIEYKSEFKLLKAKQKVEWDKAKADLDAKAAKAFEDLQPHINRYKNGYKEEAAEIKAEFAKRIEESIAQQKELSSEEIAINKVKYKEAVSKLKESFNNDIAKAKEDSKNEINKLKEIFESKKAVAKDKDEIYLLIADRDAEIAEVKLELIKTKYKLGIQRDIDLAAIKGEFLGLQHQLKYERGLALASAKKYSYKNKIESQYFNKFTEFIGYDGYTPDEANSTEFNAVRSFGNDKKISFATDKLYLENGHMILVTKEIKTLYTESYNAAMIEIVPDSEGKTITSIISGEKVTLHKVEIINYDQYLHNYEVWYVQDLDKFMEEFAKQKEIGLKEVNEAKKLITRDY